MRSPSAVPSKRWSSILEVGSESYQPRSRPPLPPTPNVTRTCPSLPFYPTYTDALLKHSKKLREQSMSPTRNLTVVNTESYTPYKTNQDYYKSNSWGVDILDWAGDEDVVAVFSLLQLNKLGISWGSSINSLESCCLVLEGLLDGGGDSVDSSKTISTIQELGGTLSSNSESREDNQELHIGLVRSELIGSA